MKKKQKITVEIIKDDEITFKNGSDHLKIHYKNINSLNMDEELKIHAAEMEAEADVIAKFYPEMKSQIRLMMSVSGFWISMTLEKTDADKIALLSNKRLQRILKSATDRDGKPAPQIFDEKDFEEASYPVHFHACF